MGAGYQAKIESLWQGYESKKAEEAALLAKSEAILAGLVGAAKPGAAGAASCRCCYAHVERLCGGQRVAQRWPAVFGGAASL